MATASKHTADLVFELARVSRGEVHVHHHPGRAAIRQHQDAHAALLIYMPRVDEVNQHGADGGHVALCGAVVGGHQDDDLRLRDCLQPAKGQWMGSWAVGGRALLVRLCRRRSCRPSRSAPCSSVPVPMVEEVIVQVVETKEVP